MPPAALNGEVRHLSAERWLWPENPPEAARDEPNLAAAGLAAGCLVRQGALERGGMLPRSVRDQRQSRRLTRRVQWAGLLLVVALAGLLASLQIATSRYQRIKTELVGQVDVISSQGQSVGQRIEQLETVRSLRARRHDMAAVLGGLLDATPPGVTYSQLDLDREGLLRLRGQAESLSLPFLLPEKLSEQPMFESVLLQDAAQVKKAGGSVVEFRLEAKLRRNQP